MARRVYVHIGTMKSATTYIQALGHTNRARLAEAGILWPATAQPFLAVADLMGKAQARPGRQGAWAKLSRRYAEHSGDAVLSNELIAALSPNRVERLVAALSPAEIHVVLTARDNGRVIPSHWQTTLKNGSKMAWSEFAAAVCSEPSRWRKLTRSRRPIEGGSLARSKETCNWFWRRHDLPEILAKWQPVVPAERITVVTVPPQGTKPEIVGDRFGSVLGVDTALFEQPDSVNSSVGAHSAELLRRLNASGHDLQRHHYTLGIRKALVGRALGDRAEHEPRFGLTQSQQDWVGQRAGRMIEQIRASSVSVVGDLDDLRPAEKVQPGLADPSMTAEADLLDAALVGLAEMVKEIGDAKLDGQRQRYGGGADPRAHADDDADADTDVDDADADADVDIDA